MTVADVTEGEVVRALRREGLGPPLRPGPVLRMAPLKAPTGAGVADPWAAAGVRLRDLPPSSPALSPLAEGWSKVKTRLRAPAARTLAALEHAIAEALAAVTSQETHGWCAHAGYWMVSN
jgi:hypothetical protein